MNPSDYSETTAAKIDEQVYKLISEAQGRAQKILTEYVAKLELIATTLLEKETIGQVEFKALMEGQAVAAPTPPAGQTAVAPAADHDSNPAGRVKPAPAAA